MSCMCIELGVGVMGRGGGVGNVVVGICECCGIDGVVGGICCICVGWSVIRFGAGVDGVLKVFCILLFLFIVVGFILCFNLFVVFCKFWGCGFVGKGWSCTRCGVLIGVFIDGLVVATGIMCWWLLLFIVLCCVDIVVILFCVMLLLFWIGVGWICFGGGGVVFIFLDTSFNSFGVVVANLSNVGFFSMGVWLCLILLYVLDKKVLVVVLFNFLLILVGLNLNVYSVSSVLYVSNVYLFGV